MTRCRGLTVLILALLPHTVSADPGAFRGPYLNNVTTDAITVLWESPTPTTGTVHYGVSAISEQSADSSTPSLHHEVRLTGLSGLAEPGSRFVYELEVDGTRYPGEFHTAVNAATPFSFIAYGDNRSSEEQHQAVVGALMAEMADVRFLVSTGDMVSDGENEAQWDTFFEIEAPVLSRLPVFLAIGNHEVDGGDWDIPERVFQEPESGLDPASDDESFYHFVYGNAEFIIINIETHTLFPGVIGTLAGEQERWLLDVLDNRPAGVIHRFLFIHQGPYSSKPGRNGNFFLRTWLDDLDDGGINIIISGHDHYAERGFAENGIHYVIHGGGGAPLYDTLGPRVVADHTIMYGETRLGYVLIHVDGARVEVEIKGLSGETVDSFEYGNSENPECSSVADCGGAPTYGCPGGSWECVNDACRYTCDADLLSSLVTCLTNSDCDEVDAQCANGDAECIRPDINPLEWYCQCDAPPQCVSPANCQGMDPPIVGCEGDWGCEDEVCEFTPTTVCDPVDVDPDPDPDEGDEPGDDPGDVEDIAEDVESDPELDAEDIRSDTASDLESDSVDSAVNEGTGAPATPVGQDDGCDCSAASAPPPALPIAFLSLCVVRRRSAR